MDRTTIGILVGCALSTWPNGCSQAPGVFPDVAADGDLEFTSYSGDNVWYLIDTMGSGLGAGDLDGDDRPDLVLLTGSAITDSFQSEAAEYRNAIWLNREDGFVDAARTSGFESRGWSFGSTLVDYDADGDLDIYVTRHGPNHLWRNDGSARFTEVASGAGLDDKGWGASAVFADLDGDGDLDVYVANYAKFDIEEQKGTVNWFTVNQFPHHFPPDADTLYRNNGDGTFTDITAASGTGGSGRSMTVLATDFDDDGDTDLFVANDIGDNALYRNDGGLRFNDVAGPAGVATDGDGRFQASMGAASGDYDNDGDMDIMVTNYGGEYHTLYRNEGGFFSDVTRAAGLDLPQTRDTVGWGIGLYDFDLDGHLDIFSVNGHVVGGLALAAMRQPWWLPDWLSGTADDVERLAAVYPQMGPAAFNLPADQQKHFFLGRGDGTFAEFGPDAGPGITYPRMSRGAAFADFDGDGRIDVAVSNKNQALQILMNRIPRAGNGLELDLRAPAPNTHAIGSRVRVRAGGRDVYREVVAGSSYCSSDALTLHVGLGPVSSVESVEIRWPDGIRETHTNLAVNRRYRIHRGGEIRDLGAFTIEETEETRREESHEVR